MQIVVTVEKNRVEFLKRELDRHYSSAEEVNEESDQILIQNAYSELGEALGIVNSLESLALISKEESSNYKEKIISKGQELEKIFEERK